MKNREAWAGTVLAGWWLWSAAAAGPVLAQEKPPVERTIEVQGEGKAAAVPDQAVLEFQVEEEGASLDPTSGRAREKMKKVFRTLKAFGLEDKDVQTVRYDVQPQYKYDKNGGPAQRVGYRVSNQVRVVLKDLDRTGALLEAVTGAGVSRVEGPTFGFSDPEKLKVRALTAAVANAREKAEAMALAAGAELGRVRSIVESGTALPVRPAVFQAEAADVRAGDVPVAQGENEVTARVEMVFSLK
jgi:uncharacterized protein